MINAAVAVADGAHKHPHIVVVALFVKLVAAQCAPVALTLDHGDCWRFNYLLVDVGLGDRPKERRGLRLSLRLLSTARGNPSARRHKPRPTARRRGPTNLGSVRRHVRVECRIQNAQAALDALCIVARRAGVQRVYHWRHPNAQIIP